MDYTTQENKTTSLENIHSDTPRLYSFSYTNGDYAVRSVGITGEWMSPHGWMPIVNLKTKKFLYDKYIS
jgi:hypothetical protein